MTFTWVRVPLVGWRFSTPTSEEACPGTLHAPAGSRAPLFASQETRRRPIEDLRPDGCSRAGRFLVPFLVAALAGCAAGPSLVDSDGESGFALYRSGRLGEAELAELCEAGVEEILVLTGDAAERECRIRETVCPGLRVRYDVRQNAHVPVDAEFLESFDAWVEEARRAGRKIAFRCRHGWHRTGRLAAYYRIRFQDLEPTAAIEEMNRIGRFMWRHRQLAPQVTAMADHLAARPCSVASRHCVRADSWAEGPNPRGHFAADTCPPGS